MSGLVTEELLEPFGHGRGDRQTFAPVSPAAGANFLLSVPGEAVLRPVSCVFTLTTSAVAANRYATVEYRDGANVAFAVSAAAVVVTASSTQRFAGSTTRAVAEWAAGTDVLFPLVEDFIDPGYQLAILVANIDAGDTLTGIRFVFNRFFTGPRGAPQGAVTRAAARGGGGGGTG